MQLKQENLNVINKTANSFRTFKNQLSSSEREAVTYKSGKKGTCDTKIILGSLILKVEDFAEISIFDTM